MVHSRMRDDPDRSQPAAWQRQAEQCARTELSDRRSRPDQAGRTDGPVASPTAARGVQPVQSRQLWTAEQRPQFRGVRHDHVHLRSASDAARGESPVVAQLSADPKGPRRSALSGGRSALSVAATVLGGVAITMAAVPTPLIIGHRGASGHRPEHTLAGYRLAAEMGADYIEPDLVSTKDGVLIARHENEIGSTTDAAMKFPDRKRTKTVDGMSITGWFSEDFTLAEIKTLRARERLNFRSRGWDGQFEVPTFDEVIDLAQELGNTLGRPIGIYPETKHPTYFRSIGLPLEDRLLASLDRHGWNTATAPVFIQSFETNLRELRPKTRVKLIQLLEGKVPTDADLQTIKSYADGIGPNTRLVIPAIADGTLLPPNDLVARAHAAGLLVHVWTLRSEPAFLPPSYHGDVAAEFRQFAALGVDGIFTDFPDAASRALREPPAPSGH